MIKVKDVAYGRLRVPDLDLMEQFLTDFGMKRTARTKTALYMRGSGPAHHLHVTEQGEPGLIGYAFYAKSEEDLHRLAKAEGASPVESIDEPGGGKRVLLTDPNGFRIEVVHGIETLDTISPKRQPMNWRDAPVERAGDFYRVNPGPSHIKRMGHVVVNAPDVVTTVAWYRAMFGLIQSDDVHAVDDENNIVGSFNRADCGEEYVDHHIFFCRKEPQPGLNHLSFEVADIDDIFVGHEYLKRKNYQHYWGIGRHLLGSQVFDYWRDPWGHTHEHWTDSDRLNAASGSSLHRADSAFSNQWGPGNPSRAPKPT